MPSTIDVSHGCPFSAATTAKASNSALGASSNALPTELSMPCVSRQPDHNANDRADPMGSQRSSSHAKTSQTITFWSANASSTHAGRPSPSDIGRP